MINTIIKMLLLPWILLPACLYKRLPDPLLYCCFAFNGFGCWLNCCRILWVSVAANDTLQLCLNLVVGWQTTAWQQEQASKQAACISNHIQWFHFICGNYNEICLRQWRDDKINKTLNHFLCSSSFFFKFFFFFVRWNTFIVEGFNEEKNHQLTHVKCWQQF